MNQILYTLRDLCDLNICNAFERDALCAIKAILKSYRKDSEFKTTSLLASISNDRLFHILSVYCLGIAFYRNQDILKVTIDNVTNLLFKMVGYNADTPEGRFAFVWMLIAVYHDAGYAFEEGNLSPDNIQDSQDFLNSEGVYTPPIYSYRLLKSYAKMKKCSRGKYDHGIFGGFRLYEDLIKKKKTNTDQEAIFPIDVYKCAAWTICCHNIFFVKSENTNPCYSRCGLSPLISSEKIRCIKYDQYPFLFLLSLVDTLEPIKRFPSDKDILSRIKIAFLSDSIQVDISDLMKTGQNDTRKYENTLDELDYWLTDVVGKRQNLKTIYIK